MDTLPQFDTRKPFFSLFHDLLPHAPYLLATDGRLEDDPRNAETILLVPLIIKLPHQARGELSERDVELVDLVPTIAAQLEHEIPWPHAGRSVFAPDTPSRLKVAFDQFSRRHELPPDLSRCLLHACGEPADKHALGP